MKALRWLPTVMATLYGKILINAALGFDSYLVMRHGALQSTAEASSSSSSPSTGRLGCYFCSDIVAATNSQRDRTLDQQCTVTRPGLSFVAAGLAAEVMIALLHTQGGDDGDDIPHQIRGSLATFTQYLPKVFVLSKSQCCDVFHLQLLADVAIQSMHCVLAQGGGGV